MSLVFNPLRYLWLSLVSSVSAEASEKPRDAQPQPDKTSPRDQYTRAEKRQRAKRLISCAPARSSGGRGRRGGFWGVGKSEAPKQPQEIARELIGNSRYDAKRIEGLRSTPAQPKPYVPKDIPPVATFPLGGDERRSEEIDRIVSKYIKKNRLDLNLPQELLKKTKKSKKPKPQASNISDDLKLDSSGSPWRLGFLEASKDTPDSRATDSTSQKTQDTPSQRDSQGVAESRKRKLHEANEQLKKRVTREIEEYKKCIPDLKVTFDPNRVEDWLNKNPEVKETFFPGGKVREDYRGQEELYRAEVMHLILSEHSLYYESAIRNVLEPPPFPASTLKGAKSPTPDSTRPIDRIPPAPKLEVAPPPTPPPPPSVSAPAKPPQKTWAAQQVERILLDARLPLPEEQRARYEFHYRTVERLRKGFHHVAGDNPYLSEIFPEPYPYRGSSGRRDAAVRDLAVRWVEMMGYQTPEGQPLRLEGAFADALYLEALRLDQKNKKDKNNSPDRLGDEELVLLSRPSIRALMSPEFRAWVEICLYEQAAFTGSYAPDGTRINAQNREVHRKKLEELSKTLGLDQVHHMRLLNLVRFRAEAEQKYPAAPDQDAAKLERLKNDYVSRALLPVAPFEKIFLRAVEKGGVVFTSEDRKAIEIAPRSPDWMDRPRVQIYMDASLSAKPGDYNPTLLDLLGPNGSLGIVPWTILLPAGAGGPGSLEDNALDRSRREFEAFAREIPESGGIQPKLDSEYVTVQQLPDKLKSNPAPVLTLVTHGIPGPTPFNDQAFAQRNPKVEVFRGLPEVGQKLLTTPVKVQEFADDVAQCFCATQKAATQMASPEGRKAVMVPNTAIVSQIKAHQVDPQSTKLTGFVTTSCDGVELAAALIEDPDIGLKFSLGFSGKVNARWATSLGIEFKKALGQGLPLKDALAQAQRNLLKIADESKTDRELYQKLAWEVVENSYLFLRKPEAKPAEATPPAQ